MNSSASESEESATEGVLCEPPLSFFLLESLLEVGGGELEDAGFRPVGEQVEQVAEVGPGLEAVQLAAGDQRDEVGVGSGAVFGADVLRQRLLRRERRRHLQPHRLVPAAQHRSAAVPRRGHARCCPTGQSTRHVELAPKYWQATRSNLDPAELDAQLCPITLCPRSRSTSHAEAPPAPPAALPQEVSSVQRLLKALPASKVAERSERCEGISTRRR
jgi:hypothetical protein